MSIHRYGINYLIVPERDSTNQGHERHRILLSYFITNATSPELVAYLEQLEDSFGGCVHVDWPGVLHHTLDDGTPLLMASMSTEPLAGDPGDNLRTLLAFQPSEVDR